jgi:uncharacterized protein (TIGR03067 family)
MNSIISLAAVALCFITVAGHEHDQPKADEARRLAGTWECVSATVDGKALTEGTVRKLRLIMTAERYRTERTDEVLFDSTYTLNVSREPKWIDMVGTEAEMKGKVAMGIYELRGDRLTICYTLPGRDRPKTFESKTGSGAHLAVWKRTQSK